jgi:DNA-binding transcriptional ArsR family regulator
MRARNELSGAEGWRQQVTGDELARAAEVLGHVADPTRLHLLWLLRDGPHDVGGLTDQVRASRSSVSQHLGRLRLAGLVRARRDGRRMVYTLTSDHIAGLLVEALGYAAHDVGAIPHHRGEPTGDDGASAESS